MAESEGEGECALFVHVPSAVLCSARASLRTSAAPPLTLTATPTDSPEKLTARRQRHLQ